MTFGLHHFYPLVELFLGVLTLISLPCVMTWLSSFNTIKVLIAVAVVYAILLLPTFLKDGEDIPPEILDLIFGHLDKQDLLTVCASSRKHNAVARRLLFQRVNITSLRRLLHFAELVAQPTTTIPSTIESLVIDFTLPRYAFEFGFSSTMWAVILHFKVIYTGMSITCPAQTSMVLAAAKHQQRLRKLVLYGEHFSFEAFRQVMPFLVGLECLVVNASWGKHPSHSRNFAHGAAEVRPPYIPLPRGIREITLSASSLTLLHWMVSTVVKLPNLHVLRLKLDEQHANLDAFRFIHPFIAKVGRSLAHLYVWFDGCHHCHLPAYRLLATALHRARTALDTITSGRVLSRVDYLAGIQITSEAPFWESPEPICGQHSVHHSLAELARSV
ncbi:hypothetical protein FA13DRAFT_1784908 [Coprinellus micaceus]|uniref:F-box domain-containing protein n=1 Tax=Coprinellus micaceus TaxID=71717 RepID=A0A4Y7TWN8_COPMI|nr:hypothetical protein FA13DRAFT_1784908 [Coprinellus micaceus]